MSEEKTKKSRILTIIIGIIYGGLSLAALGILAFSVLHGFINPPKQKAWGDCSVADCSGFEEHPN
jgi:hypothetical protein